MKIIYANIAWFTLLIFGFTIKNIERFSSVEWEGMSYVRLNFTLLFGGVSLLLVASIAGLLLKRKWGYELALVSNSTMAVLPISLFLASFLLLPELALTEIISIHTMNLVVGIVSLAFWFAQTRSNIKARYVS